MEISEIVGTRLHAIIKEKDSVSIIFINNRIKKKYKLSFGGFIFETNPSPIGKIVQTADIGAVLSFKAFSELNRRGLSPSSYKQMFLSMKGSTDDLKIELLATFRGLKARTSQII